jgi:single-stranded-DNA-specific exonuclease
MEVATCLVGALQAEAKIAIWGDYDVDGATSTALWIRVLRHLGADPLFHIPNRFAEGYGPNIPGLDQLKEKGAAWVVFVDCGTTAFEALSHAAKIGLKVIVIDHHAPETHLPQAAAFVNPKVEGLPETRHQFTDCAAVGLSFFCALALKVTLVEAGNPLGKSLDLKELLDLVALGTVCDVMPLKGLNRLLVQKGLTVVKKGKNVGLEALKAHAGITTSLTGYHFGFTLGPRINAAGRLDDSTLGTRLLSTDSRAEANTLAETLGRLNEQRQDINETILKEAQEMALESVDMPFLVLGKEGWHEGVIGIVASRLKDQFHKPTLILSHDGEEAKGSARSVSGLDVGELVHRALERGLLTRGGGHKMAAGLSLNTKNVQALRRFLCDETLKIFPEGFTPVRRVSGALMLNALQELDASHLDSFEPFGMGNAKPLFMFHQVTLTHHFPLKGGHRRFTIRQMDGRTAQGVAFQVNDALDSFFLRPPPFFTLIASLSVNTPYGVQLILEDVV